MFRQLTRCSLPAASVRAFTVVAGPIPPELTADTLITNMVNAVRFASVAQLNAKFTLTKLTSLSQSTGK